MIIDGINYRTHDYERNEIRAKFFPFQPCSPFQKPRTAGSLIPESFFWEWELVDINKIKYPSNTSNTRPTRISNLATPPPPRSYIVCRLCMEQDDSYAWNRTTVMAGICESLCGKFSSCNIQTPTTFMHIRTSKFSLITFKLTRRSPKDKNKEACICTWGRRNLIFERHTFFGRRFGKE